MCPQIRWLTSRSFLYPLTQQELGHCLPVGLPEEEHGGMTVQCPAGVRPSAQHPVLQGGDHWVPNRWGRSTWLLVPPPRGPPFSCLSLPGLLLASLSEVVCLSSSSHLELAPEDENSPRSDPARGAGQAQSRGLLWVPHPPPFRVLLGAWLVRNRSPNQVRRPAAPFAQPAWHLWSPTPRRSQLTFMRSRWCSNTLQVVCQVS